MIDMARAKALIAGLDTDTQAFLVTVLFAGAAAQKQNAVGTETPENLHNIMTALEELQKILPAATSVEVVEIWEEAFKTFHDYAVQTIADNAGMDKRPEQSVKITLM